MKPGPNASAALVRADVLVLLREKRYEEALARLYEARAETPDNAELQKGIDQVKEFLVGAYAKRLGGLDQVAQPIALAAARSPDMVLLSRYIDGTSTYGDLAEMCPLGRLRTLQVLIEMYPRAPSSLPPRRRDSDLPGSGPRSTDTPEADVEASPDTARSGATPPAPATEATEAPEAREYREAFTRGTAAFIQARASEAIEAFETCERLRPGDAAAAVMLRRARRDLASR